MAIIALNHPVPFPVAKLRRGLSAHLRQFRWQCGDDDLGGAEDSGTLDRPQLISARGPDEVIYTPIERRESALSGSPPPHTYHIAIGNPTIDDADIAMRIRIILSAGLMQQHQEDCWCQLAPDGPWIDRAAILRAITKLDDGVAPDQLVADLSESASVPRYAQPDLFAGMAATTIAEPEISPEMQAELEPEPIPVISPLAFGRKVSGGFGRKGL